ncbi:MAG: NAD-dependent epimerase/dehydratase family protein [Candidatus Saelkia tenebricola]|nr:NAD-dependent epimerase/dehydratase family protein [Candidatus Saelkia tenebricola]
MKILISGAAGMVGSHCAEFYAQQGERVWGIDNLMRSRLFKSNKKSVEYNWEYLTGFKNIERVYLDIRDIPALEDVFKKNKFDLIIHTAAQPGVGFSVQYPREDFEINAVGTFNMLELASKYSPGASFIYCSTNKVYGENVSSYALVEDATRYRFKDIIGIGEDTSIDHTTHTPYGVSKYVGDMYVQEYGKTRNIKTAVFRMSCIYGMRQFGFEDQGWLAWFLIATLMNRKITIYGDGKQVRDVLYVKDLVKAFDAFFNSDIESSVFNIGGGVDNTVSLLEYLNMLGDKLNTNIDMDFSDWRPSDQKVYISNIEKVKSTLNWAAATSLGEGLDYLISWAKDNRDLF